MPLVKGSDATMIHYEQVGEGPDIVWVSGAGGTAHSWDGYQIPFFRERFRNTTFDARGVGTTTSDAPLPWTVEDFARDTADLIRAVCDPPVALIGPSFGGGIVQQVAHVEHRRRRDTVSLQGRGKLAVVEAARPRRHVNVNRAH